MAPPNISLAQGQRKRTAAPPRPPFSDESWAIWLLLHRLEFRQHVLGRAEAPEVG